MDNRGNIVAMMTLGAMVVALGATLVSAEFFHTERPEKMGYVVEGVEAEAGGDAPAAQVAIASLLPMADPAKGAEVFKKCTSCHSIEQGGAQGIGPNLWGVVGQPHARIPGFAYSDILKSKSGPWDFEALNAWLLSPKAYAPGTKMSFAGLSKAEDRAAVIKYLNTMGSNLPMPAAAAAEASAQGAAPSPGAATAEGAKATEAGVAPATGKAVDAQASPPTMPAAK